MCLPKRGLRRPCHFCFHSLGMLLRAQEWKEASAMSYRIRDHVENPGAPANSQEPLAEQACEAVLDLAAQLPSWMNAAT